MLANNQKELQKLETKLKKQEENLRARELALQSGERENIHLRTHIQQLEKNIEELQRSNKVLRRKLSVMERPIGVIDINETSGGTVITMDTVTFEIIRAACSEFYANYPNTEYEVSKTKNKDKRGNMVHETYRVTYLGLQGQEAYTLNIYNVPNCIQDTCQWKESPLVSGY